MNRLPTPRVAVAQLGSRWNYDMPVILEALGLLTRFYTDAYCGEGSWLAPLRWLPFLVTSASVRRLQSRARCELPADKVKAFNVLGLEYGLRYSRVRDSEARLRLFLEVNQRFNRLVSDRGFPSGTNVVFSMNTASLELFEHYRSTGIKRLMDQTLVPMRVESAVLAEEYDRWPGWATDNYQDWRLAPIFQQWVEREEREWELADLILCASPTTVAALRSCGVPDRPGKDLRLLLVGTGSDANELRQRIATMQLQGVLWVDEYVRDRTAIQRYLCAGDVYTLPSRYEGFPVAPIEAMACGLPVVAADAPGVRDILELGEASGGLVVPREDVAALALALGRVLDDEAWGRELGLRARCRVEECFSLLAIGKQMRDFLFSQKG